MKGIPIGERFGRLLVIGTSAKRSKDGNAYVSTVCECGTVSDVQCKSLKTGCTQSCGCLRIENARGLQQLPVGESGRNLLLRQYKRTARDRGLVFSLSKRDFYELTSSNCHYCNKRPSQHSVARHRNMTTEGIKHSTYTYSGIDRVDNLQGYTISNCVPCCFTCNQMKGTMTYEDFIQHNYYITHNSETF